MLLDEGAPLPLPPLDGPALILWHHLLDAGLCGEGVNGRIALSWADLRAWQHGSATPLSPWHLRALHQAARAWVDSHRSAANPDAPAPWSEAPGADQRELVRNKLRGILGGRAKLSAPPDAARRNSNSR